jgi:hypothetical protein
VPVCGQPVEAFRRGHAPAPDVCDGCDPTRDQFLPGFEEGDFIVVDDMEPNLGGHDPRRRPEQRITIDSTVLYDSRRVGGSYPRVVQVPEQGEGRPEAS